MNLRKGGIVVSERGVMSVVRRLGLRVKVPMWKHCRAKVVEMGEPRVSLVNRIFDVDARNRLLVGDITYTVPPKVRYIC